MKSKTDSVSEACGTGNPSPTFNVRSAYVRCVRPRDFFAHL